MHEQRRGAWLRCAVVGAVASCMAWGCAAGNAGNDPPEVRSSALDSDAPAQGFTGPMCRGALAGCSAYEAFDQFYLGANSPELRRFGKRAPGVFYWARDPVYVRMFVATWTEGHSDVDWHDVSIPFRPDQMRNAGDLTYATISAYDACGAVPGAYVLDESFTYISSFTYLLFADSAEATTTGFGDYVEENEWRTSYDPFTFTVATEGAFVWLRCPPAT